MENERIEGGEPVGDLVGRRLRRCARWMCRWERAPSMIDEYPVLAVAAACAGGPPRLRGLAELRVKESDRLAATAALLAANGARVEIEGDDLIVHGAGPPAGGGMVATHMDHRLAMSALVLGAGPPEPVSVDDAAFIDTSFPGFVALMNGLGAPVAAADRRAMTPLIIAIDGPAAAGKGTLARRLAAAFGLPYLDTGLLYRAVGRRVLDAGADPADPFAAEAAARGVDPAEISSAPICAPPGDAAASAVAAIPGVRAALLDFQRNFGRARGAVLDGRDIGTVIFPDAAANSLSPPAWRRGPTAVAGAVGARRRGRPRNRHRRPARPRCRRCRPRRRADETGRGCETARHDGTRSRSGTLRRRAGAAGLVIIGQTI